MYIGLDIGGHKINGILMRGNKIIRKRRVATKSTSNKKIIIAQIFDCVEYLIKDLDKSKIKGIGIGAPGPIDLKRGVVLSPPNVKALAGLPLADLVQKKFKTKVILDNDVNCFGIAEGILGAGKGKQNIVGLTLGTGVGGCLILRGKLFHGRDGSAGEIGHVVIKKDGWKCSCKNKGCLEAYVSARGIMRVAKEIGCRGATPTEIMRLAKKDNKKALKVYQITGGYLGIGLANLVNILNPDIIIIGGGIANVGEILFNPARKVMRKNILSPLAKNIKVVRAKLNEDAGAIGAALLIKS